MKNNRLISIWVSVWDSPNCNHRDKLDGGSSGGKMIVNSGKWTCGTYGKGVQANSVSAQYVFF